jgi:glycosyltransferase involved in cell wall biosynthesis
LQYTTMAWSRRGLPFGALTVLAILRRRGVRCAVVFHEPSRQTAHRWFDPLRGASQDGVVRKLYRGATKAIFVDPLHTIAWLPAGESKSVFIPIGANIPEIRPESLSMHDRNGVAKTVVVFCLSDLPNRHIELSDISHAMGFLAQQGLKARVVFLGRGTAEAKQEIELAFDSIPVEVANFGLQSAGFVSRILCESDAMLCVRGPLYPRRASAIAGIACGLPIVGYSGLAAGTPLEDAGLRLVPYRNGEALGPALVGLLTDDKLQAELRARSRRAHQLHFSWDLIASKLLDALDSGENR